MRFICSSSTSAWAKSVLIVTSRFKPALTPYLRSIPMSRCTASSVTPALWIRLAPPVTNGVNLRSRPRFSELRLLRVPARLTRVMLYGFGIGDQNACSFLRPMFRMRLIPQLCGSDSGKRRVIIGIAISATQPLGVCFATTSQTPSQSRLILEDVLPERLPSPSLATCWSSIAPRGLVTNMYAEREALKVARIT